MSLSTRTPLALRQEVYISRCRYSRGGCIYQFSRTFNKLVAWPWPALIPERVPPDDSLRQHRCTHQMLGPCCLCPLIYPDGPDFVESAMYLATIGPHAGQYVASCAKDKCGYIVPLESFYSQPGLYIKNYPRRAFGERVPPLVLHVSEGSALASMPGTPRVHRPLKRTYAMMDVTADGIQEQRPLKRPVVSGVSQLLASLDSTSGITRQQFKKLFLKCDQCCSIMTRRAFPDHNCEVIDLTSD